MLNRTLSFFLFLLLSATGFVACGDAATDAADVDANETRSEAPSRNADADADERPRGQRLNFAVGDCVTTSLSATMVADPSPEKVPCGSDEAKSKVTKVAKDRADCGEGYLTTYGDDDTKVFYCLTKL